MNFVLLGYISLFSFIMGFCLGIIYTVYQDKKELVKLRERNIELHIMLSDREKNERGEKRCG